MAKAQYNREQGDIPISLRRAVNLHCRSCNDVWSAWNESNDCTVFRCWLYPFRPGKGGDERVQRKSRTVTEHQKAALALGRLDKHQPQKKTMAGEGGDSHKRLSTARRPSKVGLCKDSEE